jgi:hypothetical protein
MEKDIKVRHFSIMSHLHPTMKWSEPEAHFYFQLNSVINQFAFKGDGKVKISPANVAAIVFKKVVIGDKLQHSLSVCFQQLADAKATDLDTILDTLMAAFVKHNEQQGPYTVALFISCLHLSNSLLPLTLLLTCVADCAHKQCASITLFSWLMMSTGMAA